MWGEKEVRTEKAQFVLAKKQKICISTVDKYYQKLVNVNFCEFSEKFHVYVLKTNAKVE